MSGSLFRLAAIMTLHFGAILGQVTCLTPGWEQIALASERMVKQIPTIQE